MTLIAQGICFYQSYAREMAEAKGWTRLMTNSAKLATAWMLHDMRARGIVPRALIFNRVNPIIAQGAAFGGVALVDRFAGDVTQLFRTGDMLHVDPAAGLVEILNRDA